MHRTTARLLLLLVLTLTLGGVLLFTSRHRHGQAEDLLGFQPVTVCSTGRDLQPGRHSCPQPDRTVASCAEATATLANLAGVLLASQEPLRPAHLPDCELAAVDRAHGVYAFQVHAYYRDGSALRPTFDQLYATYSNFDQSPPITARLAQPAGGFRPFTVSFLVRGEPGFHMVVSLQGPDGSVKPGAGIPILVSCGTTSDTMIAEPNGTSWFSFQGYERLHCGDQPLTAQVLVARNPDGSWVRDTPTYSYLYQPVQLTVALQNRPQPIQAAFAGAWQGIGALVRVSSQELDGSRQTTPLAKVQVRFSCDQSHPVPSPSEALAPLEQPTDSNGRASLSLADAELTLQGCPPDHLQVSLAAYGQANDPSYPYYFPSPGPLPAGRFSGAHLSGGLVEGNRLELGGTVSLADVGSTPGGYLGGSTICLFSSLATAQASRDCSGSTWQTQADPAGRYLFGDTPQQLIAYGQYLRQGKPTPLVRILNYKGQAYPASVTSLNGSPYRLDGLSRRDITLPSGPDELPNHVCLAVSQVWHSQSECAPLFNIIFHESSWNVAATNSSSGACGLFQANPCQKYQETALPGESYVSIGNQIRWGIRYIQERYGSPSQAWSFWQANGHY